MGPWPGQMCREGARLARSRQPRPRNNVSFPNEKIHLSFLPLRDLPAMHHGCLAIRVSDTGRHSMKDEAGKPAAGKASYQLHPRMHWKRFLSISIMRQHQRSGALSITRKAGVADGVSRSVGSIM